MSMNLALKKRKIVDSQLLFQTPTNVTKEAMASKSPFEVYKNWLLDCREGKYSEESEEHLKKVIEKLKDGYEFVMI